MSPCLSGRRGEKVFVERSTNADPPKGTHAASIGATSTCWTHHSSQVPNVVLSVDVEVGVVVVVVVEVDRDRDGDVKPGR